MKMISKILGITGILCLLSAAGNDDYAMAAGENYPIAYLVAWTIGGIICLGAAWLLSELSD